MTLLTVTARTFRGDSIADRPLIARARPGDIFIAPDLTQEARYDASGALAWEDCESGVGDRATSAQGRLFSLAGFTLSSGNNTLTANVVGALHTALGYAAPFVAGDTFFLATNSSGDGLWTVSVPGDGATAAVLNRPAAWRTFASLPALVVTTAPDGVTETFALVAASGFTPGASSLPYIPAQLPLRASRVEGAATLPAGEKGRVPIVIEVTLLPLAAGAADDVTLVLPYAFKLLRVDIDVTTVVALSTVTARTAAAGGGAALSGDIPTAALGVWMGANVAGPLGATNRSLAAGSTIYFRRSDRAVAGTAQVWGYRS